LWAGRSSFNVNLSSATHKNVHSPLIEMISEDLFKHTLFD